MTMNVLIPAEKSVTTRTIFLNQMGMMSTMFYLLQTNTLTINIVQNIIKHKDSAIAE